MNTLGYSSSSKGNRLLDSNPLYSKVSFLFLTIMTVGFSITSFSNAFGRPAFSIFTHRSNKQKCFNFLTIGNNQKFSTTRKTPYLSYLSSSTSSSNEYIVQARLSAQSNKRQTRKEYLEQDRLRNLSIKRKIYNSENQSDNNDTEYVVPDMFAIRVSVDSILREELKMNGREKRGRVFIDVDGEGCKTLKGLKYELHSFFRSLKKSSFILSAGLPTILDDGSVSSPLIDNDHIESDQSDSYQATDEFWSINNDEDVIKTFQKSQEFFESHNSNLAIDSERRLKRPSILIHVKKDPNAPPPPPLPTYLIDMPDPNVTPSMTMLSFYAFPDQGVKEPEEFSLLLRSLWKPFNALGRVYVANEGINAQMAVPTNILSNFMDCCMQIPELGTHMENGINIDPIPLSLADFAVAGDMDGKPAPPFKNLHIRVRSQIVADGLDKPLDWQNAGYDMPPLEWHQKIKDAREKKISYINNNDGENDPIPLIFDCRNTYESSVGRFEESIPLDTENFRDSWDVFKEKLKDVPKDAPIMTYCTGGIRCVKVGAYLTQEMGFTNVSRLAGGIIAYDRTLNENAPSEEPMFKGTNFVFDGRVGRQITDDAFAECITCGDKTNLVSNCGNENCHKRMVQCASCRISYLGTCSGTCKSRVINRGMSPRRLDSVLTENNEHSSVEDKEIESVEDYSFSYSTASSSVYDEIVSNTEAFLKSGVHMVSDGTQGKILKSLASMTREGRVLEIGTFSGYATTCFVDGVACAADSMGILEVGGRDGGPFVMTLERDARAVDLAVAHLDIVSRCGITDEATEKASQLRAMTSLKEVQDISTNLSYKNVGIEVLRVNDALATVEAMATGNFDPNIRPFDIVFIDGDKTRFLDYVEALLRSDKVLKKGGIMLVDNVLWKGLVVDIANGKQFSSDIDTATDIELKKSKRARKLANLIHRFNDAIVRDNRVEVVMLPVRDGLSIIRKK